MHFYTGNIEPADDVVFVFGSNPDGRHGAGSAKVARTKFGAIYGQGEGLQGHSYALPTKDLRIPGYRTISEEQIIENIDRMYKVAESMPEKKFMVAYRTKADERSLCGYSGKELVDMFLYWPVPENVYFSEEWKEIING